MLSGWNWTPWILYFLCLTPIIMPSEVSAVITRSLESVFLSIIRLWYRVASNLTGAFLKIPIFFEIITLVLPCISFLACIIFDPKTCPIIWCPKQTPRIGIFLYNNLTILIQLPAWLGLPGPGDITIFLYFFLKFL